LWEDNGHTHGGTTTLENEINVVNITNLGKSETTNM
jgi:hypothetical protein